MTARKRLAIAVLAVLAVGAASACGGFTPTEPDEGEPEKEKWREASTGVPPYPRDEDLVPIDMRGTGGAAEYLVDLNSITSGVDLVVRYTVVVRTRGGALNVIHEGLRCDTRQHKTYAFGTRQGEFKQIGESPWKGVRGGGITEYRVVLMDGYLCDENGWALNREQILRRFKLGPETGSGSDEFGT